MPKAPSKPKSKAVSASAGRSVHALIEETLSTLAAADKKLHAFVRFTPDLALAQARLADAQRQAGAARGLLHGMPIAVKDIVDVEGVVSGCGSLTRAQAPPAERDAHVVMRLRAGGAIFPGKTHTVEYAFGGYGTNITVGTPWNPWDLKTHRVPGGSSSGSGAIVGAGLLPAALGTDTGGSVRIPAGLCGCVGLKTSIGLVGRSGVAPLSQTLDTVGPIARDVTTAARMLAVMQGHDPADPSTSGAPSLDPLRDLERGIAGLRIGRVVDEQLPLASTETRADFACALDRLAKAGAQIVPIRLPCELQEYTRRTGEIIAMEGYANWGHFVDDPSSGLAEPIRTRMLGGKALSSADYIRAIAQRGPAIRDFLAAIDRLDAVVLPTMPYPAIPVAEVDEGQSPMGAHTRWVNYLGLAALAIPTAIGTRGLPLSLQIVVRCFDDSLALRIGRAFELARGPLATPRL